MSHNECPPTALFRGKNCFEDFSDSSLSSFDSKDQSLADIDDLTEKDIYSKDFGKSEEFNVWSTDRFLQLEKPSYFNDEEGFGFTDKLYERVEEFLDCQGMEMASSPMFTRRKERPTCSVILKKVVVNSESNITTCDNSPFSDTSISSMPSFLARRSLNAGDKRFQVLSQFHEQLRGKSKFAEKAQSESFEAFSPQAKEACSWGKCEEK